MAERKSRSKTPLGVKMPSLTEWPILPCNHDRSFYRHSTMGDYCILCNPAGPPFRDSGNPLGESATYAGVAPGKRGGIQAAEDGAFVRQASSEVCAFVREEQQQMSDAILAQLREYLKGERAQWIVENHVAWVGADGEVYVGSQEGYTSVRVDRATNADTADEVPGFFSKAIGYSLLAAICSAALTVGVLFLVRSHFVVSPPEPYKATATVPTVPHSGGFEPGLASSYVENCGAECDKGNSASNSTATNDVVLTAEQKKVLIEPMKEKKERRVLEVQVLAACWLTVKEMTPAAKVLVDRLAPADYRKKFSFAEGASIEVRAGCPGSVLYWLNGEHYVPVNESGKPDESEVANIHL